MQHSTAGKKPFSQEPYWPTGTDIVDMTDNRNIIQQYISEYSNILMNKTNNRVSARIARYSELKEGAENLKTMYNKIDTQKMNNPAFMMIITATGQYAYQREDGIYIVPIGCLKN